MTRIAKKSDIDGYDPYDFRTRGGGGRRGKPLLYRELDVTIEGMYIYTQARNHLSPKGLLGLEWSRSALFHVMFHSM